MLTDTAAVRRWLRSAEEPATVLLACCEQVDLTRWTAPAADRRVVHRVAVCLAELPVAAVLEIVSEGARVVALLDGCAHPAEAERVLQEADRVAAAVGRPDQVEVRHDEPPAAPSTTAPATTAPATTGSPTGAQQHWRGQWTRGRRHARDTRPVPVLDAAQSGVDRRVLIGASVQDHLAPSPEHPGHRLYAAVRALLAGAPVPPALEEVPTGSAYLEAPGCVGSGVCVRACPTDALRLTMTDLEPTGTRQYVLEVRADQCVDCGRCTDLCPESAMTRVGPLPWTGALAGGSRRVSSGLVHRCERCSAPIRDGRWCTVCSFRITNPFGSRLPPGFSGRGRS